MMKLFSSSFIIGMAANSANAADNRLLPHTFWLEMSKEVQGKLNVLKEKQILQTLVNSKVLGDDADQMTMYGLFGVYGSGLVDYLGSCDDEIFGEGGKHTDLICRMDRIRHILSKDQELPVSSTSPLLPFQAAKPSVFGDEDKMARTYCADNYPISAIMCPKKSFGSNFTRYQKSSDACHIICSW